MTDAIKHFITQPLEDERPPAKPRVVDKPKREWVGLTEEEINWICFSCFAPGTKAHKKAKFFYEQLEAKLRERNT